MYTVLVAFRDLQDNHRYAVGDVYPAEGASPTKKRIEELASSNNKAKKPLIEKIPEVEEVIPEEEIKEEAPKKKSKKKGK